MFSQTYEGPEKWTFPYVNSMEMGRKAQTPKNHSYDQSSHKDFNNLNTWMDV